MGLPQHSSRIMASGRCSGGGSWSEQLMGCLGGGGDDEAAENAPAEVVREVALEPVSPSRAGETYEQHLALKKKGYGHSAPKKKATKKKATKKKAAKKKAAKKDESFTEAVERRMSGGY